MEVWPGCSLGWGCHSSHPRNLGLLHDVRLMDLFLWYPRKVRWYHLVHRVISLRNEQRCHPAKWSGKWADDKSPVRIYYPALCSLHTKHFRGGVGGTDVSLERFTPTSCPSAGKSHQYKSTGESPNQDNSIDETFSLFWGDFLWLPVFKGKKGIILGWE